MAFSWNFKPKTLNGFNPQSVESLAPQAPQPLNLQMKGMENTPANQPIENPLYQRAAYMDEYEADETRKAQALQAQQAGQEKRIADIQNEIATLEKRIAENTTKLQKWVGPADQIAAIESRKINAQDPTSIWRWKEGINQQKIQRQEDMDRIKAEKEANKDLIKRQMLNKVANTLGTIKLGLNTTPEQAQQYRNTLAGLLTEAQNAGIEDLSSIQNTIAQLDGSLPYEQMQDLASQIALYDKYFDKMNSSEDGYGSEGKYDVYANNLKKIWDSASEEMRRNREFKTLYDEALEKHKKDKKKGKPGAPKMG